MATTIKLKNSVTTTNAPSSLVQGEVAINITDKKVWVGNAATTPIQLLGDGASLNFTSLSLSGNLTFTGTGNRITGDFSSTSPASNRVAFQSSTTNGNTVLSVIPNGTATQTNFVLYNGTDLANSSSFNSFINTSEASIRSGISGTGTYVPITMFAGGSERLRIDTSGNVLIGTTSAATSSTLNVVGAGYQPIYVNTTATGGGGATFSRSGTQAMYVGTGGSSWLTGSSTADGLIRSEANMLFAVGNTERMRITSGGDLLVGTTSTYNSSYRMSLAPASGTGGIVFKNANTNPHYPYTFLNSSGTTVGYIEAANTATTYVTTSDYRLKENIEPMTGALSKVQALNPVTYTWKADGSNSQGFIAHELQAVVPECVTGEKDAVDAEGNPKYQGIDTSFLVATLTAAIQEQQAMIEELKAKVTALENK